MASEVASGRTRWLVFAIVFVCGLAGVGVMFAGLSNGALAASFAVSGTSYKATADQLDANGVVQYGSVDQSADQAHPVMVNGFSEARLDNFCQSILLDDMPGIGQMTLRIEAPGDDGMTAENLVLGVEQVNGDLTLDDVQIGRDAGTFDAGPSGGEHATTGNFGIQAGSMHLSDLKQKAWSTTASTLRLNQVEISAEPGRNECF
ncbi:DUF6230 family protein [Bounagaea algeriensis]